MKKIVVITPTDPTDKFGHSGVVYSICSQISKENKIIWLKPKVSIYIKGFRLYDKSSSCYFKDV